MMSEFLSEFVSDYGEKIDIRVSVEVCVGVPDEIFMSEPLSKSLLKCFYV